VAAENVHIEILHKLLEWAREVLTQEDLNNIFLAKDIDKSTAWDMAAGNNQIEVL
jgi:hypothetical protein